MAKGKTNGVENHQLHVLIPKYLYLEVQKRAILAGKTVTSLVEEALSTLLGSKTKEKRT